MPGYHETLLQLTYTRVLILFGLGSLILAAVYFVGAGVNVWLICATLGMMALINLFTYARLHSHWPVTESELFSQLCADAILYGALIYQTGGATNPFIFLLLVPLLISAATLSWRFTWLMAVIVVLFYSSLLRYYLPVLPPQTEHYFSLGALFDLHIIGMWLNFLLTVLLITWFLVRMQHSMRMQERRLHRERERRIRDQQMVSLATFAAGTAHELGTPLSTMSVILKDMALTHTDPETAEDIALLQQQVGACSDRLQAMARSARDADITQQKPMELLLDELLDEWQIIRPQAQYKRLNLQAGTSPLVATNPQLKQALTNLLNNAADASEEPLEIELDWDQSNIWLRIHDQGPGLPLSSSANLGRPFVTTKGKGLGIGLFLTATTLAQHEGEVRLYDHPKGGTLTEVRLPTTAPVTKEAE